uniref:Uncharacterized protein n=1 Tax=Anas platyrhynchos TaxID=8839 RepID=A0A8B9ZHI6_ANAPL
MLCMYDPSNDSWQDKSSLSTPRGWHCAVSLLERVYVMGGSQLGGRGERVDVLPVECYSPYTGQWMLRGIYLVGGWNEIEKKYKKCIQCYNPDLNEWTEEDELPEATVGVSCCTISMPNTKTRESRASSVSSVPVSI